MTTITPFLWFNDNAEEAVNFYTSVFEDSKILDMTRYGEGAPIPAGTVMTASFQILGQTFTALNGGPQFSFTEAISFVVTCETQDEIDYFWAKLTEGGSEQPCGWAKDKFGLSWQIVPAKLGDLLSGGGDPAKAQRAMGAMFQMTKLVIADLENA